MEEKMKLRDYLKCIELPNEEVSSKALERFREMAIPIGSLGRLENMVAKICGITGKLNPSIDKKAIVIMCADNGVVARGVSSCPKDVTRQVSINFTRGITTVNSLARQAGADLHVIDVGIDAEIDVPGIINKKIRRGTHDISQGPAMTREEAELAMVVGIEAVGELKERGYGILGTGEMGIGNTTTSSAVVAALTAGDIDALVGKGSGLTTEAFKLKKDIVRRALDMNRPESTDGIDVVAKVGGFDIAGLAGVFIGGAYHKVPIVVDGFISGAAALVAAAIEPGVREYMFPSHGSAEPGTEAIFRALDMTPYLNLGMRLGEGTGTAIAFHLFDSAMATYRGVGTFDEANFEKYVPLD